MRVTMPSHLTRLEVVVLKTSARHVVTTEDLKLENPGVPGYVVVSLGDVETWGTTHLTTRRHSPKDPIPQKQRSKKLKSQFQTLLSCDKHNSHSALQCSSVTPARFNTDTQSPNPHTLLTTTKGSSHVDLLLIVTAGKFYLKLIRP